jgi:hypothetical protein
MSPTEQALFNYVRANPGRTISAYELRDAVIPGRDVKNVHVMFNRIRKRGNSSVVASRGPFGGYRWWL